MKASKTVTASFLLICLLGSLFAAPRQPPGELDSMTFAQAENQYGEPDSIYLDGKGGAFWLFTLPESRRLMIEVAPHGGRPGKRRLLPPSWRPAPGGRVYKEGARALTLVPAPRRSATPRRVTPDRYHPGVKLLARGF